MNQELVFLTEEDLVLYDPELAGLFKKLKRHIKKRIRSVKKIRKKIHRGVKKHWKKIVIAGAIVATIYFAGPVIAAKLASKKALMMAATKAAAKRVGMTMLAKATISRGAGQAQAEAEVYGPPEAPRPGGIEITEADLRMAEAELGGEARARAMSRYELDRQARAEAAFREPRFPVRPLAVPSPMVRGATVAGVGDFLKSPAGLATMAVAGVFLMSAIGPKRKAA